jgi:hypothetical protein
MRRSGAARSAPLGRATPYALHHRYVPPECLRSPLTPELSRNHAPGDRLALGKLEHSCAKKS